MIHMLINGTSIRIVITVTHLHSLTPKEPDTSDEIFQVKA